MLIQIIILLLFISDNSNDVSEPVPVNSWIQGDLDHCKEVCCIQCIDNLNYFYNYVDLESVFTRK